MQDCINKFRINPLHLIGHVEYCRLIIESIHEIISTPDPRNISCLAMYTFVPVSARDLGACYYNLCIKSTTRDVSSWIKHISFCTNNKILTDMAKIDIPQRTHDSVVKLSLRYNDAAASFWRNNDVIIASDVRAGMPKHNKRQQRSNRVIVLFQRAHRFILQAFI